MSDFMPMGMPPVMVDYEDFAKFMAQEERIVEADKRCQQKQLDLLDDIAPSIIRKAVSLALDYDNLRIDSYDVEREMKELLNSFRLQIQAMQSEKE